MSTFASKSLPTTDKLRGGYYTPSAIARFLSQWAAHGGEALLEPSCGDGAILCELTRSSSTKEGIQGVELFEAEADKARAASHADVHVGDFFEWFTRDKMGTFDGVAGNPPYIRFGNWPEKDRGRAMDLMEFAGLRPSRLTNAWVPFTVATVLALRTGGHFGLVLPAELLQVSYAAQLRKFLVGHCSKLALISFRRLVFEDVLQEIVLLMGVRGEGPAVMHSLELEAPENLPTPNGVFRLNSAPMLVHDDEKWTKYFLSADQIDLIRAARSSGELARLGDFANIEVGVVTGRNAFFTMTPSEARSRGIERWCRPLVARSSQLSGVVYDQSDFRHQMDSDVRCLLLALQTGDLKSSDHHLSSYIRLGESEGVHGGYKCSIRRDWWAVPTTWIPDGFMLRQIHRNPLLVANRTIATSTDTVHRVRLLGDVAVDQLVPAVFNSVTFAMAEILGRSYGGGILELEPSEARDLPIVPPQNIDPSLGERIDELIRENSFSAALDFADDELLVAQLGWDRHRVGAMREVWTTLRDRRLSRGKRGRPRGGT